MNSQNTADFTKDIQSFDLEKQDTLGLDKSESDTLKSTLNLALDVIVKLSKTLKASKRSDDELGQLEDIDSLASL